MIIDFDKILNDLSSRLKDGTPDLTNEQHLIKLFDVLKEYNWPVDERVRLLQNLTEARFDKKSLNKMRDDGDAVFKKIDTFIKNFVNKLNRSSIKPGASLRKTQAFNIKAKSRNPRVDVTIDCKNIGNGSRELVFDEVDTFKGDLKTKYSSSNTSDSW